MFEQTGINKPEEKKDPIKTAPAPAGGNNFIAPASYVPSDTLDQKKKKLLIIGTIFVSIIIIGIFWFLWTSLRSNNNEEPDENVSASSSDPSRLGESHLDGTEGTAEGEGGNATSTDVEYLSFADFYQSPATDERKIAFASYDLPLNVKVDVANYYELSRKINLEKAITSLNNNGFAVIDNPWVKEAPNFYALAASLDEKQIPLYISADFISYYYQSALKSAFKEIEEGVFYESLWQISKELFDSSRLRYEAHLAQIGTQNDRVLEGERLEAAFFAVSLELLKPRIEQVDTENKFNTGKFSVQEKDQFSFTVPPYLRDDVLKELELIRAAKIKQKSPVLLYDRDYKSFLVPAEYKDNARLQNFYLAAAWLNSVFPLNYRDETCPSCLLDHDDWRINFTAASLIAQDFAKNQTLKDEWARVYKTMSFFKGLRDTWDYVDYRDEAKQLFGQDYDVTALFAESAASSEEDMEKLRHSLLQKPSVPMQGGVSLQTVEGYKTAGFQFLADFYWPNKFIFDSLSYPKTGAYLGAAISKENVSACTFDKRYQRCQGSGQDILALIYPSWKSSSFSENSNYTDYPEVLTNLRPLVGQAMSGQLNNYWSSLHAWRLFLLNSSELVPPYLRNDAWEQRMAISALGAWTDMQLPLDKLTLNKPDDNSGLAVVSDAPDLAWVEPSLELYDRLLAHNQMVLGMFQALGLNDRSSLATNHLRDAAWELNGLKGIAEKQARGEALNADDTQFIRDFAKLQYVEKAGEKTLIWNDGFLGATLKEKLNTPSIIIVAHKAADDKIVFAAGPAFNYQESK